MYVCIYTWIHTVYVWPDVEYLFLSSSLLNGLFRTHDAAAAELVDPPNRTVEITTDGYPARTWVYLMGAECAAAEGSRAAPCSSRRHARSVDLRMCQTRTTWVPLLSSYLPIFQLGIFFSTDYFFASVLLFSCLQM